jgi:exodeoxyribonuclease VII small subunit
VTAETGSSDSTDGPDGSGDASGTATIGYADAVIELGAILAALDDDHLDIDELGDHVARAAELIAVCRERISVARLRVDQIVADLDGEPQLDLGLDDGLDDEDPADD